MIQLYSVDDDGRGSLKWMIYSIVIKKPANWNACRLLFKKDTLIHAYYTNFCKCIFVWYTLWNIFCIYLWLFDINKDHGKYFCMANVHNISFFLITICLNTQKNCKKKTKIMEAYHVQSAINLINKHIFC